MVCDQSQHVPLLKGRYIVRYGQEGYIVREGQVGKLIDRRQGRYID